MKKIIMIILYNTPSIAGIDTCTQINTDQENIDEINIIVKHQFLAYVMGYFMGALNMTDIYASHMPDINIVAAKQTIKQYISKTDNISYETKVSLLRQYCNNYPADTIVAGIGVITHNIMFDKINLIQRD